MLALCLLCFILHVVEDLPPETVAPLDEKRRHEIKDPANETSTVHAASRHDDSGGNSYEFLRITRITRKLYELQGTNTNYQKQLGITAWHHDSMKRYNPKLLW